MYKAEKIQKKIIEYLRKQEWPVTTGMVAKAVDVSWQTAQIHLFRLAAEGKVKYKKVGRQNQWWLEKKYKENF